MPTSNPEPRKSQFQWYFYTNIKISLKHIPLVKVNSKFKIKPLKKKIPAPPEYSKHTHSDVNWIETKNNIWICFAKAMKRQHQTIPSSDSVKTAKRRKVGCILWQMWCQYWCNFGEIVGIFFPFSLTIQNFEMKISFWALLEPLLELTGSTLK